MIRSGPQYGLPAGVTAKGLLRVVSQGSISVCDTLVGLTAISTGKPTLYVQYIKDVIKD